MGVGGKRPGAGRKPKVDEEKVRGLAVSAIEKRFGSVENGFDHLLQTGEASLVKFVWEHAVGKPRDKMDMDMQGKFTGPSVVIQMPEGTKIELPENTEEPDLEDEDTPGDTPIQE